MTLTRKISTFIKSRLKRLYVIKMYLWIRQLFEAYKRVYHEESFYRFVLTHKSKFILQKKCRSKAKQIEKLFSKLDISPAGSTEFFYSIDCFKTLEATEQVFFNYSMDYATVVSGNLGEVERNLAGGNDEFSKETLLLISTLRKYVHRIKSDKKISEEYSKAINAIESLFSRPSETFYEGLQRILFYNQILWQTRHNLNGLGRLDQILGELYKKDLQDGRITKEQAENLLTDFLQTLHVNYWFKSAELMGDTGQIIILGGVDVEGNYLRNDLTDLFIEVSAKLRLPDPKILLRCSAGMPEDLLETALQCIATGIGAPLLSNDDIILPELTKYGYKKEDACNYVTSACWEPLVAGKSCDQNNMACLNFAEPFVKLLENEKLDEVGTYEALLEIYERYLEEYIGRTLSSLQGVVYEIDPILSLVSQCSLEKKKDITQGGADYNNIGLTSVGMANVVNSLLNVKKLVFSSKKYSLSQLNEMRKKNYIEQKGLLQELKSNLLYGTDDAEAINLVNRLTRAADLEFKKYKTKYGGKFKYGLSAPGYLTAGKNTAALFDGRCDGEPMGVHISSPTGIAPTELILFASKLNYSGCRINGNVVDFIVSPVFLKNNIEKFAMLIKAGLKSGVYQLQMNVVDSKTLLAAKKDPEKFPNLIVRVWGFSAYFKDLPEEYKEVLIKRTLESEASEW